MAWGKTDEQKAADAEQRAAQKEQARREREEAEYWESPLGQADWARQNGTRSSKSRSRTPHCEASPTRPTTAARKPAKSAMADALARLAVLSASDTADRFAFRHIRGTNCTTNTSRGPLRPRRSGLADLGRVGFDDAGRTVEVLVALMHATLAIAGILSDEDDHGTRYGKLRSARPVSFGRGAHYCRM